MIEPVEVIKVAQALFKRQWPFYQWDTQNEMVQYRFMDEATALVATLAAANLIIVEKEVSE